MGHFKGVFLKESVLNEKSQIYIKGLTLIQGFCNLFIPCNYAMGS